MDFGSGTSKRLLTLGLLLLVTACSKPEKPILPAETSNYTRTASYSEVMDVVDYVAQVMNNAYIDTMGYTTDGKMIPLVILSDQKIRTPEEAESLGRPLIFVLANIHAGEVEGKEAMMKLLLEFSDGMHKDLLSQITIMIVPIYNADGNDDFARTNRISQNGPDSVGVRTNKQGYDLNRDYMKLESPEAKALIGRAFSHWDPILFMDLHTTNGSYHGYHLTYSIPLNPNTHPQIISFQDKVMIPAIKEAMAAKDWRIFEYGNFVRNEPDSGWATFSPQPRYGTNYYSLRNRLSLLSESYSYVDFKNRVASTYDFVVATLRFCAEQSFQLIELKKQLDDAYSDYGTVGIDSLGTTFTLGEPVIELFVTGSVDTLFHADIDRMTYRMLPETGERSIRNFRNFVPVSYEMVPYAYFVDNRDGVMDSVLLKLSDHKIPTEIVSVEQTDLEVFIPDAVSRADRPFQNRYINRVSGSWVKADTVGLELIMIRTDNPLRNLIFYLLEPTMDDGLVAWGFADKNMSPGESARIFRKLSK